jgi:hypothetical protein
MRSTIVRVLLALLLFSSWLALLFSGLALGGAVHLLLGVALGVFPWRIPFEASPPAPLPGGEGGLG